MIKMARDFRRGALHAALMSTVALMPLQAAFAQTAEQLDPIVIEGEVYREKATGPVEGVVAKRSASGTKTDTALVEVPQSVSVITADQIEAQAAQTSSEALRYTPGVISESFGADPRSDWIRVRGFQVPEYLDGMKMPMTTYAWARVDPYMLERLEVLKGPAAVAYGQTPPGGMVNAVSKRPKSETSREVQLLIGDPQRIQTAFDASGAINEDGSLMYRLSGLGRLAETQVDYVDDDRTMIAPAFTYRPNQETSLTILTHYIRDSGGSLQFLPASGTALPNANGKISRDTFTGEPDFDDFTRRQWALGYELDHEINPDLKLHHAARYSLVDYDLDVVRGFGFATGSDRLLSRRAVQIRDEARTLTVDTNLTGEYETGVLDHTVLAGIDVIRQDADYTFGAVSVANLDIYNPSYGASIGTINTTTSTDQSLSQVGAYIQDQIRWDGWNLTLSGRHDWSELESLNRLNSTKTSADDTAFSGRAGLMYNFENGLAPYASYATSFEAQTGSTGAGVPLKPTEGEQFELGVKYDVPGTNALLTASVYDLTQTNLSVNNGSGVEQIGEVNIKGLELEARMNLADGWDAIAGYSYSDSEITKSTSARQGNHVPYVPVHQASMWVNHTFLGGALNGITLGGGARYVDGSYGDQNNTVKTEAYTLFDAAVSIDVGEFVPVLEGAEFSLNAANLMDEEYVSSCNSLTTCYWGTGRTVRGTITYRW